MTMVSPKQRALKMLRFCFYFYHLLHPCTRSVKLHSAGSSTSHRAWMNDKKNNTLTHSHMSCRPEFTRRLKKTQLVRTWSAFALFTSQEKFTGLACFSSQHLPQCFVASGLPSRASIDPTRMARETAQHCTQLSPACAVCGKPSWILIEGHDYTMLLPSVLSPSSVFRVIRIDYCNVLSVV